MPAVQRVGDRNSAGGVILQGDSSVRINGRAIAIENVSVSPHPCCGRKGCPPSHCNAKTQASGSLRVNGKRVILTNDKDTCGHPRVGGSTDVRIG